MFYGIFPHPNLLLQRRSSDHALSLKERGEGGEESNYETKGKGEEDVITEKLYRKITRDHPHQKVVS